ncbi:MAG TPA: hypothetical protein VFG20_06120 [Planctomycetaceae bacterium]|nr:hypothetical protein [Planctomycetaceae bacterium]
MIQHWRRAIFCGFIIWLVPFLVAVASMPVKTSWRSLFESIMAVTVASMTVLSASWYFRRHSPHSIGEGIALGLVWMAISVCIDLPLMLGPPVNYTVTEYVGDIGLTYLMMPIIVAGMACSTRPVTSP